MSADELRTSNDILPMESMLSAMAPAASHIDRDRLMFLAGQATLDRGSWTRTARGLSPTVAAASLLLSAALGFTLWRNTQAVPPGEIAGQRQNEPPVSPPGSGTRHVTEAPPARLFPGAAKRPKGYFKLRNEMLARGVDSNLPAMLNDGSGSATHSRPAGDIAHETVKTNRELLQEFLRNSPYDET